jgi:LPXTG-motif cell wall-anchored protein
MNVGQLVGGIVCLAASALLGVLSVVLPEGKVVFMIGDSNMPIVPIVGLALLGIGLILSALRRQVA